LFGGRSLTVIRRMLYETEKPIQGGDRGAT
jgi:hypothetical protein